MLAADIPVKFPIPWGENAGGSYIRNIPTTSQIGIQNGAASLNDGFVPLNFEPIGSGGVPPFGQDMNGILKQVSQWCQWMTAGGGVPFYDAVFSAAIDGYPTGAFLQATSGPGNFWISTVDNNVSDPDTGGANWTPFPGPGLVYPTRTVTSSATLNLSCTTDYAVLLNRSSGLSAMVANLAASGTLLLGQTFEIYDGQKNFSQYPVTVTPPSTHKINGQDTYVMNVDGQGREFKYFGSTLWGAK